MKILTRYGFYTPDLAMEDVGVGELLRVEIKIYDEQKDMMYWEFVKEEEPNGTSNL